MMGILINNMIWIDKHGPYPELFNGPNYKWLLLTHCNMLLTINHKRGEWKNALTRGAPFTNME